MGSRNFRNFEGVADRAAYRDYSRSQMERTAADLNLSRESEEILTKEFRPAPAEPTRKRRETGSLTPQERAARNQKRKLERFRKVADWLFPESMVKRIVNAIRFASDKQGQVIKQTFHQFNWKMVGDMKNRDIVNAIAELV